MSLSWLFQVNHRQQFRQGLLVGITVVVIALVLLIGKLFESRRLSLSNAYFVPAPISGNIVIIALDDASVQAYGRSPAQWPRTIYADLLNLLDTAQARVVAFDLLFDTATPDDGAFAEAIQTVREGDSRIRTVLAQVGVQLSPNVSSNQSHAIHFDNTLSPIQTLSDAADYLGYVNAYPDIDGEIRRQASQIEADGEMHLSFDLAVYSAFLRIPASAINQVIHVQDNQLQITPERSVTIDELGLWIQNYFGPASNRVQSTFPVVSLYDVLNGQVDSAIFSNKLVLVGVINNTDSSDRFPVPSDTTGRPMTGVEIHANAIETLIQNRSLQEQSLFSQVITIIGLGLISSLIYAQVRWYWTFPVLILALVSWLVFAFVIFSTQLIIINLFHSSLTLVLAVLVNIGLSVNTEIQKRKKTEFLLKTVLEISSQHMAFEKILPSIAADVQRITHVSSSEIWLYNEDAKALQLAHPAHSLPSFADVVKQAQDKKASIIANNQVAVPILWQKKSLGVIAVLVSGRRSGQERSLYALEELVRQLAPNLENTLLYTELKRQNTLVETVFAGSPSAILVLNDQMQIIKCNTESNRILATDDLTKRGFFQLLSDSHISQSARTTFEGHFRGNQPFRQELQIGFKTYTLDAAFLAEYKQWVVVLTDISTMTELSKLKTQLIRMASHDLKNPLSHVMGYAGLLLDMRDSENRLSEQNHRFVSSIMHAAEIMQQIINDILSLEQLRSEVVQYDSVDLCGLVSLVVADHQLEANSRHQSLTVEIQDDIPTIRGNQSHITQAVINLVNNAIKYTPDKGEIIVRLLKTNNHQVRLEVEDTGYGIPEESQPKLFTEFYRVKTAETEGISGTGLGLSLVKSIIEAHHGRVWFRSQQGVGSTFFVELPINSTDVHA